MDTKAPTTETPEETPEAREKLLGALKLHDRMLVEDCMENHPGLTAAEAIEMLTAFGGL
jgi:hypothetical protein